MMSDTAPVPPVLPPVPKDPLLGMKLGDYVVESLLASGGMGLVYKAKQPLLGKLAAVKVLREEYARDDEQISRFLKEAQAISAIHHRGIIDIITFGHLPDERQYMVMEYLDGETLEAVLQRDAPLPPARALPILDEVLDALSAAHKVGVVHRDLKPSNVFITRESNGTRYAKLVDFGLAKQTPLELIEGRAAKASLVAGTPEYISPEQAQGLAATPQTDLYCFGVMAFEVLTGKLPFAATTVDGLLRQHVNETAPRMSVFQQGLPEALDELVAQCLEKEPEKRPQSADVVRQVLGRVMKQIRDESTRQGRAPIQPKTIPIDAPATGQAHAEAVAQARAQAAPVARAAPHTTDIISRTPSEDLRLVKPSRAPLMLGLLFFFLGAGLLTWAFWPAGKVVRPERGERVEVPAPAPEPAPPAVTEPVAPRVEDDLAALPAIRPEPGPKGAVAEPAKKPEEPSKPVVVALPAPPKITAVECEPTDLWKKNLNEDLLKLGTLAARTDAPWSEEEEAALKKRIDAATSANECAAVKADFEKMLKAVTTH